MRVTVYHNPRCSKSRQALQWLDEQGIDYHIKRYLDEGLTADEINHLKDKLAATSLRDFMRQKEEIYAENQLEYADETALLAALIAYPKLLERPIILTETKAIVARPPASLADFFTP